MLGAICFATCSIGGNAFHTLPGAYSPPTTCARIDRPTRVNNHTPPPRPCASARWSPHLATRPRGLGPGLVAEADVDLLEALVPLRLRVLPVDPLVGVGELDRVGERSQQGAWVEPLDQHHV